MSHTLGTEPRHKLSVLFSIFTESIELQIRIYFISHSISLPGLNCLILPLIAWPNVTIFPSLASFCSHSQTVAISWIMITCNTLLFVKICPIFLPNTDKTNLKGTWRVSTYLANWALGFLSMLRCVWTNAAFSVSYNFTVSINKLSSCFNLMYCKWWYSFFEFLVLEMSNPSLCGHHLDNCRHQLDSQIWVKALVLASHPMVECFYS